MSLSENDLRELEADALDRRISNAEFDVATLTYALEIAGERMTVGAVHLCLNHLSHVSPIVREGAVIGLMHALDHIVTALENVRDGDGSPGVRETACDALECLP